MTKALCSIGAGPHAALLAVSEPTFRAYADRHGYKLVTSTSADPGRPPAWAKVAMLRELVDAFDLVLWIDADAVVIDGRDDIAAELEPGSQLGLVQHGGVPNTGVMVWRSGEFARALLERMWNAKRLIHHPWWENAALLDALGYDLPTTGRVDRVLRRITGRGPRVCRPARPSPFSAGVQFLAPEWNWAYLARVENPRIVHCLGVPVEQRLTDMQAAIEGRLR